MHSLHRWNGQAGIWKWIGWNFFSCNWLRLDPIEFWCIGNISVREIFKISTLKRIKLVDTLNCYNIKFCNSSTLFSSFPRHAKVLYLFIFRLNLHKLSSPMLGLPLSVSICARWILHWIRIKKFIRSEEHSKLNAKLVQSRVEGGSWIWWVETTKWTLWWMNVKMKMLWKYLIRTVWIRKGEVELLAWEHFLVFSFFRSRWRQQSHKSLPLLSVFISS